MFTLLCLPMLYIQPHNKNSHKFHVKLDTTDPIILEMEYSLRLGDSMFSERS